MMLRPLLVVLGLVIALPGASVLHAESPRERAAKLMKKLARDKDPDVRAEAASDLGDMGAWDAVPALAAALKDSAPRVRANASYALSKLKERAKEAIPALKEALHDSESLVRFNAAVALGNLEAATPEELAPVAAGLLDDADEDVRKTSLKILLDYGFAVDSARAALLEALEHGRPDVRNQLLNEVWTLKLKSSEPWAKEVVAALVEIALHDDDPKLRRMGILGLRALRPLPPQAGDALIQALDDSDAEVASAAAGSLNSIESGTLAQTAVSHLVKVLRTGAARDRADAAHTLGSMIGWREKFLPALVEALAKDKDAEVRAAVVETLGALRSEEAIAPLLQALKADASARARAAAASALAVVSRVVLERVSKLDTTLAALDAAGSDPDPKVRTAAAAAALELRR